MYVFFVFLTTTFSHRCSYTVHIRPHNVVLTTSQYTRTVSVLYTHLKISHIRLSSDPVISTFFYLSNWNLDVAHLQYIICHCGKFQNPRTEASYQSAADKVLYKHPQISQNRLSSDPRYFDNFWSIKMKPWRCTPAINILSLCEVSEP